MDVKEVFDLAQLQAFVQPSSSLFAKAIISFASSFCLEIVTNYEKQTQNAENAEYESPPFFVQLISTVLKYIPLDDYNVRYHACSLLAMLFTNFGTDISISDVICDRIQRTMLERAKDDPKPQIRQQAIRVLTRLQDPHDINCPVIQSFINSLGDPSTSVRKTVIESIAPCRNTFTHIITRLRDVDPSVRASTYTRLSKLSPKSLDANEEDIKQTELTYERLLPVIFTMMSLQELVQLLGLDESKVVPIEELTTEKVTYWSCLISNLLTVGVENTEFEEIPTVVSMVTYIENFVKSKSEKSLESWEYLEHQQILRKLFELVLKLDNSDEFGRQMIRKLLDYVLVQVKMQHHVLNIVIKTFHSILPDTEQLAYEICSIITDIKDPLEPLELPLDVRRDQEIQIAQLKVKHHMKIDELKRAIDEKQYEIVDKLSKEAELFENQIKELQQKFAEPILVRKAHIDMDTVCRCLDIVISFFEILPIEKLPNSLLTFKEEFLTNKDIDVRYPGVYQRMFKLSCLYSVIDKDTALQSLETICAPLLSYRVTPSFNKNVLKTAIGAISDLIRIYGPSIFNDLSTKDKENSKTNNKRGNDRTLYCEEDYDTETQTSNAVNIENATSGDLIDIMLSILDDNHPDLRAYVAEALTKLVVRGLCMNSSLITRLLLKWFNPTLDTEEKYDRKVQQYIGVALTTYIRTVNNAPAILEKAVIPTLCYIGNAPKTSPLAALDISVDEENLIKELSEQISLAQTTVTDKVALTSLKKFYNKLNQITSENDTANASINTSDLTVCNNRSSTMSRPQKRKISSNDTSAIEKSTDQIDIDDNNPSKFTASSRRTRCSRITNGPNLHTIEEQTENVENSSYNVQTPSTTDSSRTSNSSKSKVTKQNKNVISRKRKKVKGKKKTSSFSSNTSSDEETSNTCNKETVLSRSSDTD
ncbi:hypothetical protein Trydic_g16945 [Trypoxylus dichotomus]